MEKKFTTYEKIKLATIVTSGLGSGLIAGDLLCKMYPDDNGNLKTDIFRFVGGVGLGVAAAVASSRAIELTFKSGEKIVEAFKTKYEGLTSKEEESEDSKTETEEAESDD